MTATYYQRLDFDIFLWAMIGVAIFVFIILFLIPAGYGKMIQKKWGKPVNDKLGWIIMEVPVVIIMTYLWMFSSRTFQFVPLIFFIIFNVHYIQRTFIFPMLMRGAKRLPWTIILFGMTFNIANAFMQGLWIFYLAPDELYTISWIKTPQFIGGVIIFFIGYFINLDSDHIVRNLRKPGDTNYYIPRGGMFKYVTSANYFGEFIEWLGWAILTFSWAGLVFAFWTFANLAPRADTLRRWYREKFGDEYPKKRKRMIPFIY